MFNYVQVYHSLIDKTFHYITGKGSPVHKDADLPCVRICHYFAQLNLCREDEMFLLHHWERFTWASTESTTLETYPCGVTKSESAVLVNVAPIHD